MCMANTCNLYTFLRVSQFSLYIFAVWKRTVCLTEEQTEKQMDRQRERKTDRKNDRVKPRAKSGKFNIFMSVGLRDSSQKPRI